MLSSNHGIYNTIFFVHFESFKINHVTTYISSYVYKDFLLIYYIYIELSQPSHCSTYIIFIQSSVCVYIISNMYVESFADTKKTHTTIKRNVYYMLWLLIVFICVQVYSSSDNMRSTCREFLEVSTDDPADKNFMWLYELCEKNFFSYIYYNLKPSYLRVIYIIWQRIIVVHYS